MNRNVLFLTLITIVGWSSAFASISAGLRGGFEPNHLILLRLLIASLLFLLYAIIPKARFRLPYKEDILRIFFLGIIGITFYHIGITYGQQYVKAGTTSMIVGSAPIFTTLIAIFFLKERMKWYGWVGLAVGFIGVTLITFGTGDVSFSFNKGLFPIFFATISTSFFFVYQKVLLKKYHPIELTAYLTWAATIPLLIFLPSLISNLQTTTMEANLAGIYVGVVPSAICYATWALATSKGNISQISSLLYLETPLAIVIAWIWLSELPSILSMIGGFIAISSVAIVNWVDLRKIKRKQGALS